MVEASIGGPGKAPVLQDGQLQLGHITSTGDLDVYRFSVTDSAATGSSARVLLSNIPEGVDYDLAVYGPRPESLRGAPSDSRSALVEASFDLNPDDDVLPTDVVDDIAVDINAIAAAPGDEFALDTPYALRDISSRRSSNDEEVTIPAVVAGETYIIAVSSYYNDLSPEPYGLRVRLDGRNAIPACATSATYPAPVQPVSNTLPVKPGTNTLYVTNLSRLAAENTGSVAGIINGIEGTDGVNGVQAGILQVDGLTAWTTWNTNRCDPDARNAVVSAIGDAIDGAIDASGDTVEHIVLVGGDGVIPMAAVPDLTTYSNESTFARELLTSDGKSNEAVAALASGYLLSDDPYATDAGIAILGGDHELYLPERSIGRLVETTGEIAGQLSNFAAFAGTLDPGTFEAAVTAYDFLDDGGDAIAEELRAAGFEVDQLTDAAPLWDREAYLDLLAGAADAEGVRPGIDRSIVSPNAHYDFESLLPAAPDSVGYFTDEQLVTTADVAGLGNGFDSLVFTVGCHAGFSVSDVQLQNPVLDWAQLNARNTNQFVAHTTYGYGDTTIVAYSERLAKLFAENVAAMVDPTATNQASLGQAVRDAKERYLAGTLVLTPYDEKILQSWTYLGLPMYKFGDIGEPNPDTTGATGAQTTTFLELAGATTLLASAPLVDGPASFATENGTTTV
ncbi:MAG TPA: C25 family cysteine peptidase, partial [Ilumatobacteraceae bacterium]|nr:C25 family cysteine peptidase [Ilumatobacteraceae bacterium]